MKRLAWLDAMRGVCALALVPFHGMMIIAIISGWGREQEALVEYGTPAATGLAIFFFVTGLSLAVSLASRLERQSFSEAARSLVPRYGAYMLIGMVLLEVLFSLALGGSVDMGNIINMDDAIASLGLTAILALPFVYRLSWRQLAAASLGLAVIMSLLLSLPQASSLHFFPVRLFFTNSFAVFKTFPLMFVGAAIGKLVLEGRNLRRLLFLVGGAILAVFLIVPSLTGAGSLVAVLFTRWTYYYAILFTLSIDLSLFGLVRFLDARHINLTPLGVLGRTSIIVWAGSWIVIGVLALLLRLVGAIGDADVEAIGEGNIPLGLAVGFFIGLTVAIWIFCYFYSKWRWGPPSTWYGPRSTRA